MHVVHTTLSIALARTVANTLLYRAYSALGDWSHLIADITRILYRRLGLMLAFVTILRFLFLK